MSIVLHGLCFSDVFSVLGPYIEFIAYIFRYYFLLRNFIFQIMNRQQICIVTS